MSGKYTKLINNDLLEGSNDSFRNSLGGFYQDVETSKGDELTLSSGTDASPANEDIEKVFFDLDNQVVADYTNLTPSYTFPVRIASNSTSFLDYDDWRTFVVGGVYADKSYEPKVTATDHEYRNFSYELPYTKMESLGLENEPISQIIQISYDYTQHLSNYESQINNFQSDLLIPNYYSLSDYYTKNDGDMEEIQKAYPAQMLDWITLNGNYTTPEFLFSFNESRIPYDVPSYIKDSFTDTRKLNTNLTVGYLTSSVFSAPVSSSTTEWALSKQQNIFLDDSAIQNLNAAEDLQDCLPYKMKISFPTQTSGDFVSSYVEQGFDDKLLNSLNEAFVREEELQTGNISMELGQIYLSAGDIVSEVAETTGTEFRQIDYIEFLTYCRDQYTNNNPNTMFIGEKSINRISALDSTGIYRHNSTIKSLSALTYANEVLNSVDFTITSYEDLFSGKEIFNETIAYRIEKIAGPPAGDGRTQNVLQNYWYLNSSVLSDLEFFDSQVKYGTDYTYQVYAYVLVGGYKYNYSDLRVSRGLGCSGSYTYGVEFYDPANNETMDRLFDGTNFSTDFDDSTGGTYGTPAQISSNYQYLADFNITYEPSIKLVEVPIYSKTLRILDNPPNRLNITPFQVTDDSQRIGFNFYYDSFNQLPYPSVITETEEQIKEAYLNGKDIAADTKITEKSVSRQANVEIYRLSERPNSLQDFDQNIRASLGFTQTTETYIDQIATNQKYYYFFRVVNEQGTPGITSEIYEVELINDGGYKFALFNVILDSELEEQKPTTVSKSCKKIFQLKPNISQIQLNTEDVDFEQSAASQLSNVTIGTAEDLIWDKTFKVRLTSRKTSKKIDVNITYKISSD